MTLFSCDVEADGPTPGRYSMLSLGLVAVRPGLSDRWYAELRPVTNEWIPEATAVSGLDRDRLLAGGTDPRAAMTELRHWVTATTVGRPVFISDNPGFDFAFVNHYFWCYADQEGREGDEPVNPFGHSSRRIGDIWSGLQGDAHQASGWKSLRATEHTHHALDDAVGNAEALLAFHRDHGWKASLR